MSGNPCKHPVGPPRAGVWQQPCCRCGLRVSRGEAIIAWIEDTLVVPDGKLRGQKVKLLRSQRRFIKRIYDNPHRTRTAILSEGRKNGKTALAAMLTLVHLCGPMAIPNSQLYTAAQSRDQAAVLFGLGSKMVLASPDLVDYVTIRDSGKELLYKPLGTFYKALSADAATKYGLSPIFAVHDELGQVKGEESELYDAIETGMAAHEEPLSLIISTQAATDGDMLSQLIDDALEGTDPHTVLELYWADPEIYKDKDAFGIEAIKAANPAFGIFQNADELLNLADKAQRMPARENPFRNLNLNQRVERTSPFISRGSWSACDKPVLESFNGLKVYAGFDLSEVQDLTSFVLITEVDTTWHVKPYFFLPEVGLRDRTRRDKVPYKRWAEAGHIFLCPGKTVSYSYVAKMVVPMLKAVKLQAAGFDRWGWRHFEPWLKQHKAPQTMLTKFEPVGMGEATMTPALRTLEQDILDVKIAHGGHPVLTWCMNNAVCHASPSGSRKLDKARSSGRIDGAVALTIARHVAAEAGKPRAPKIWNM